VSDTLIIAPFFGEFGWQLMAWQGIARKMAAQYRNTVAHCMAGYRYLYEDFADTVLEHTRPANARVSMWHCIVKGVQHTVDVSEGGAKALTPCKQICMGGLSQDFIRFGEKKNQYDEILIHARNTDNSGSGYRNWPVDSWLTLVAGLSGEYEVISVGTETEASYIPGTTDARGMPLNELFNRMREARLFISPSSGPAHLASLCGLPHVIWSDERQEVIGGTNRDRYERIWNPFNTPCRFIPTWQPTPETVLNEVKKCLSR